jgi:hypothetical protein
MERNLQDQMANMAAQQYAQNYAQAQNLYGQQQGRTLQGGQLYGTLGVQQAALGEAQQRLYEARMRLAVAQKEARMFTGKSDQKKINEAKDLLLSGA